VLLAPTCATCGAVLRHMHGGAICEECWSAIRAFSPPVCDRCGDPLLTLRHRLGRLGLTPESATTHSAETSECTRCLASPGAVDRARAIGSYDGRLRDIIHALKYGRRRSAAPALGRLMRHHGRDVLTGADIVVPVPLHWARLHGRGFNQAELLAEQLGLPVGRLLRRVRRTRPQIELPALERHANVEGAFDLRSRDSRRGPRWLRRRASTSLAGLTVVLVDDVSTTGATLDACARKLKQAGAREVRVLTAARVATRRR
jgi:ComF family protein